MANNGIYKKEALHIAKLLTGKPSPVTIDTEPWAALAIAINQAPTGQRAKAFETALEDVDESQREHIRRAVFAADPNESLADMIAANDFPLTDTGNAEMLAALFGDTLRYDHRRNRWLAWTGQRWEPDMDGCIDRICIDTIRERYKKAADLLDDKARQAAISWALSSESKHRLGAMASLAQSLRPISNRGDQWDDNHWLLGCTNGVVDLRTGELRQAVPGDNITMTTNMAFDAEAQAPRWEQFLLEVFEGDTELVDFIRRSVGYSLTGDTREQCLFLCHGAGANGKSTMLESLRVILGEYSANTPFNTFEQRNNDASSNDIAALYGKRLVTASETNEAKKLNEARAKSVTGGDPVTARFLFGEYFTYTPTYKIWLAMNHKPTIIGSDDGIWRRIRLIPFNVSFKGRADKKLTHTLKAEAPGILAWAVRGCIEWQQCGLAEPAVVLAATAEYRIENDVIAQFIEAQCVKNNLARVKGGDLYAGYKSWAIDNGDQPLTNTAFGRRVKQLEGITSERVSGNIWYIGLGLILREEG